MQRGITLQLQYRFSIINNIYHVAWDHNQVFVTYIEI